MQQSGEGQVTLGYAREFSDPVRILSGIGRGDSEKRQITEEETGIYIYHKNRMTRALHRTELQAKRRVGRSQVSFDHLTGVGITGYVEENHLVQHHTERVQPTRSDHPAANQVDGERQFEDEGVHQARRCAPLR